MTFVRKATIKMDPVARKRPSDNVHIIVRIRAVEPAESSFYSAKITWTLKKSSCNH